MGGVLGLRRRGPDPALEAARCGEKKIGYVRKIRGWLRWRRHDPLGVELGGRRCGLMEARIAGEIDCSGSCEPSVLLRKTCLLSLPP